MGEIPIGTTKCTKFIKKKETKKRKKGEFFCRRGVGHPVALHRDQIVRLLTFRTKNTVDYDICLFGASVILGGTLPTPLLSFPLTLPEFKVLSVILCWLALLTLAISCVHYLGQ